MSVQLASVPQVEARYPWVRYLETLLPEKLEVVAGVARHSEETRSCMLYMPIHI